MMSSELGVLNYNYMSAFDLHVAPLHLPLLGNSLTVGLFSLLHLLLAGLSVGFMVLAPIFEMTGRSISYNVDLARTVTRFTVIVFSVSSVLAVIMVELLIGLFPLSTMWLWNRFRGPLGAGIAAFIVQLAMFYPYYHFWEALRRRSVLWHTMLGALAGAFMLVWAAVLDGVGSYMLTPIEADSSWGRLQNPTWFPLVLHRLVGDLMIAGFTIAAYGAWRSRRNEDKEQTPYYSHLFKTGWAIGLGSLLLQPMTGLLYALIIRWTVPAAYEQLTGGSYRFLFYFQFGLIGALFLGNYVLLNSRDRNRGWTWPDAAMLGSTALMVISAGHPPYRRFFLYLLLIGTLWVIFSQGWNKIVSSAHFNPLMRPLAVALGVLSILVYLTMGTIRETSRRPDTVRGKISLQDEMRHPAAFRETSR